MNIQERDLLKVLYSEKYINQRILADLSGHSLGVVNRSLKQLVRRIYKRRKSINAEGREPV